MDNMELLAPAGNYEAFIAAVESGADAIYLGGTKFSARAFADNFDSDTIIKAVKYAHIRNTKVYVTINTLIADTEMEDVAEYLTFLYNSDVDAIILQDFSIIEIMRELLPDFHMHCSTQMTIHDIYGAHFMEKSGAKRVVLARELSLEQINNIAKNIGIETEVFIHGALCVCYSGQCLMSSLIGGRSGNRGMCAQPCRRSYNLIKLDNKKEMITDKYIMSTRDLNTFERFEEIVESSISSVKIEGRMKKPEYVAVVVNNYRRLIDSIKEKKIFHDREKSLKELTNIFNRDFTQGYIFGKKNSEIVSIDRPDNRGTLIGKVISKNGSFLTIEIIHDYLDDGDGIEIRENNGNSYGGLISGISINKTKVNSLTKGQRGEIFFRHPAEVGSMVFKTLDKKLNEKAINEYSKANTRLIQVKAEIWVHIEQPPKLILTDEAGNRAETIGNEKVARAEKSPITLEKLKNQLLKTGDTPYSIELISSHISDSAFLPISQINELRRSAIDLLNKMRSNRNKRESITYNGNYIKTLRTKSMDKQKSDKEYIAGVQNAQSALGAIEAGVDTIYVLNILKCKEIAEVCKENTINCYLVLPAIILDDEKYYYERMIQDTVLTGVVISNIGQFDFLNKLEVKKIRGNYTLNLFNSLAVKFYNNLGLNNICLSTELNLNQIKYIYNHTNVRLESLVYGYIPVMTTDYCPISFNTECNGCGNSCKIDEYALVDRLGKEFRLIKTGIGCRTQILNSDVLFVAEEMPKIISTGISSIRMDFYFEDINQIKNIIELYKDGPDSIDYNERINDIKLNGFTKGHFYRGVI